MPRDAIIFGKKIQALSDAPVAPPDSAQYRTFGSVDASKRPGAAVRKAVVMGIQVEFLVHIPGAKVSVVTGAPPERDAAHWSVQ